MRPKWITLWACNKTKKKEREKERKKEKKKEKGPIRKIE